MIRKLFNFLDKNLDRQIIEIVNNRSFGGPSGNTEFEADGTMVANGDATVWNDINVSVNSLKNGANAPSDWAITGTTISIKSFAGTGAVTQSAHGSCEILHDYKEGSDITPHVHFCPTTTGAGNIKWQLEYAWINRGGTISASTTISVVVAAGGIVGQTNIASFPAISGTGKTMGGRFVFRIFRDPTDAADTYAADAGITDFGIHYERDTMGSRTVGGK